MGRFPVEHMLSTQLMKKGLHVCTVYNTTVNYMYEYIPGGEEEGLNMKGAGMLVISLRGVVSDFGLN